MLAIGRSPACYRPENSTGDLKMNTVHMRWFNFDVCSALTCQTLCKCFTKNVNNNSIKDFQCNIMNGDLACQETEQNVTPREQYRPRPQAKGNIAPLR